MSNARIIKRIGLANLLAVAALHAFAAQLPAGTGAARTAEDLFRGTEVLRLRIEIGARAMDALRRSAREDVSGTFIAGTQRCENVGIHLKGATGSFRGVDDKPSFTLSFDRFISGQRFRGLRKIHLNNSVEDPSYLCEWLGSEMFQSADVPAARTAHALVELNGRALGLYVLKEGFTEEFLALHFSDAGGLLYEPGIGHDVNEALDGKPGGGTANRAGLDALASAALEPDFRRRWDRLEKALDVDRFISFMALEVMLAHRDGYCLARNNFRVHADAASGRITFLAHGMDQLFGTAPPTIEPLMNGLVARAVLETPQGRAGYRQRFGVLFTNLFRPEMLSGRIDALSPKLRSALPKANVRDFERAVADLKSRIAQRHVHLQKQLAQPELRPLVFHDGVAGLSGWVAFDEPVGGAMKAIRSSDGKGELHIRAGPRTASSWRTKVRLAAGRYRFEGAVRAKGIQSLAFGRQHGAALRVWGATQARSEAAPPDSRGQLLRIEFEVNAEQEVELGCELRASGGEAWFDRASLRLVRMPSELRPRGG